MRLLFVTARPPWPGRRGDQARTAGFAESLSDRHAVRVATLAPRTPLPPPVDAVDLRSWRVPRGERLATVGRLAVGAALDLDPGRPARPLQAALYRRAAFHRWVSDQVRDHRPDAVIVVLSRLGDLLPVIDRAARSVHLRAAVVVDLIDALSESMARRAERQRWASPLWRAESRRLRHWDVRVASAADAATVVATRDRDAILAAAAEPARLGRRLEVVPFGLRLPSPDDGTRLDPEALARNPERVVLTGNLGYFPTAEGARWFAEAIWPRVRATRPDAEWLLAGARPGRGLRRLIARTPGARVEADPVDLATLRRSGRVAIAPLRAGSGTQIKILEAIADGLPVVTTPAGGDGLDGLDEALATHVEAEFGPRESATRAVQITADPAAFADVVIERLASPRRTVDPTDTAWRWLRSRHDLGASSARFESVLERAVARRRRSLRRGSGAA